MLHGITRYEMETTVNYNAEEKTAVVYTRDKSVMRKLDKLVEKYPDVYKRIAETSIDKTYEFPKRMISYRSPRILTEEQRVALRERMAKARAEQQETDLDELDDEELEDDLEEEDDEDV